MKFTYEGKIKITVSIPDEDESLKPISLSKYKSSKDSPLVLSAQDNLSYHKKIRVEVEDTGIGIKREDLDRLFRAFSKVKSSNHINT